MKASIVYLLLGAFLVGCDNSSNTSSLPPADIDKAEVNQITPVQLGPRPFYLVDAMADGALKQKLQECAKGPFFKSEFSIAHRGAPLQFPEHTKESYMAAARQGAGVLECDVTFTKDQALVCRHSQCDLHTTTNILEIPALAAKCSQPFVPADPVAGTPATAQCCTSDITLAEFKQLRGKMDGFNPQATTAAEYVKGTPPWRTELYAATGTLLTHAESIELFRSLGVKMTPELKAPSVEMPFNGSFTQRDFAQKLIDEYKIAGVDPSDVALQSFQLEDLLYWMEHEPAFAQHAIYLDDSMDRPGGYDEAIAQLPHLKQQGVRTVAPPIWVLLALDDAGNIVPSRYARAAKAEGLNIITWSLERSGPLADGGGYYYQSVAPALDNEGDVMEILDVLTHDVGVQGIFSDWPATVTYFANCMQL